MSSAQSKKKAPLPCCCNQVWMRIGGHILWNVTPICETFDISCLLGKHHTRNVLGNHLKDRSFRLVHWSSIPPFLRVTSQESISLERKSYLDCSLDTLCTRVEFGRVIYWLQTLRSWRRWTHRKSTQKKTQCETGDISQTTRICFFHSQMHESKPLEEIRT